MSSEQAAQERLLNCAKKEFLEKGYQKASLRSICTKAHLTTGAVYFLFKDKEGLFSALVEPVYQMLLQTLKEHFSEDETEDFTTYIHTPGDHDDFAEKLVHVLYSHYDEVTLLLSKSAGSKYENIVDQMIELLEVNFRAMAEQYAKTVPGKKVSPFMTHWLSHVSVLAFVHLISHIEDEEKALKCIKPAMEHIIVGWLQFGLEDEK